jgi:hypothetical protein
MKLVQEIGGADGQHVGNTLQDLMDAFLLRADAYHQMDEWHAAKKLQRFVGTAEYF